MTTWQKLKDDRMAFWLFFAAFAFLVVFGGGGFAAMTLTGDSGYTGAMVIGLFVGVYNTVTIWMTLRTFS